MDSSHIFLIFLAIFSCFTIILIFVHISDKDKDEKKRRMSKVPNHYVDGYVKVTGDVCEVNFDKKKYKKINEIIKFKLSGEKSILSISNFHQFKNLTDLDLSNNNINNTYGFKFLSNLKFLDVSRNQIQDMSGLLYLTNLEQLDISYNSLNNCKNFCTFVRLRILDISFNSFEKIELPETLINLFQIVLDFKQFNIFNNNLKNLKEVLLQLKETTCQKIPTLKIEYR